MIDAVSWLCLVVVALWVVLHPSEEESTEAPPPRLTLGAPPPGCNLPTEGKTSESGGIPHVERLRLERYL